MNTVFFLQKDGNKQQEYGNQIITTVLLQNIIY